VDISIPQAIQRERQRPRAAYFVALQQVATIAVHFGQVFILSRLLLPRDYGVVAMAGSIFSLAAVFKDFGFSTSTIQAEKIEKQDSTNLFWIGMLSAVGVVAAILVSAPLFSIWFREQAVAPLLCVFAITFLIDSAGNQPTALAQREFQFQSLAIWKIAGLLIGLTTGVVLALRGFGPWSIVSINCVEAVVTTLGAFWISGFRPGWIANLKETKEHFKFGGALTLGGLISYASNNVDRLILGRFFGAESLGLYTRAHSLLILPMSKLLSGFKRFNIASLSRLASQPEEFRASVSRILMWYLVVCSFIVVPLAAYADDVIQFAMGSRWKDAAPLFVILSPLIWVHVTSLVCYLAHVSKGDVRGIAMYYAINFLLLSGSLITVLWSKQLSVVAAAYCLVGFFGVQSTLVSFAWRRQFIDLGGYLRVYAINAAISGATFGLLKAFQLWVVHTPQHWLNVAIGLAISIPLMVLLYSLAEESRVVMETARFAFIKAVSRGLGFGSKIAGRRNHAR
jgi:PST family polysaccharide transporter